MTLRPRLMIDIEAKWHDDKRCGEYVGCYTIECEDPKAEAKRIRMALTALYGEKLDDGSGHD